MFYKCNNIVGEKGTIYDSNHIDATYAHVDGGIGHVRVHAAEAVPVNLQIILNFRQTGFHGNHVFHGFTLCHHRQQPLFGQLQLLLERQQHCLAAVIRALIHNRAFPPRHPAHHLILFHFH